MPGLGGSAPGGVCFQGGGSQVRGVPGPGGCLLRGVSAPGEVPGLGGLVSQHALRQKPPCEQNDKEV